MLLTEQSEDYDSRDDPEYVPPPSVIYTRPTRKYDEYLDDGDKNPEEVKKSLILK